MTTLHATLVTPLTGPLSLFGKTCATAMTLWAKRAANLPSPWARIDLNVLDVGSDVGAAMRTAQASQPDVLIGPYGSGPMIKAARASERLLWNHGGASSRLTKPNFPQVINVLSPASTYFASILQAIHSFDPTARTVSLFHSTTGFGRDVAAGAMVQATQLQMTIHAVPYESSQALARVDTVPDGDILLVAGSFADEQAVAPLLLSRNWRFTTFVGAGVEEVLASLGELKEGLIGPAQWVAHTSPPPDEGPDAQWFVTHYREVAGSDPPYAAAQAFATGILYARCLRESRNPHDEMIKTVAQKLACQTLFGKFQLDPKTGLQMGHQVVIVQWQKLSRKYGHASMSHFSGEGNMGQENGEKLRRFVVWPPEQAERPLQMLQR